MSISVHLWKPVLTSLVIGLTLEYAAANPTNPLHVAILAEPDSAATTLDLLNRNPVGLATLFIIGLGFLPFIQGERHFGYLR